MMDRALHHVLHAASGRAVRVSLATSCLLLTTTLAAPASAQRDTGARHHDAARADASEAVTTEATDATTQDDDGARAGDDDADSGEDAQGGRRGKRGKRRGGKKKKSPPPPPAFKVYAAKVGLKPLDSCSAFGAYALSQRKRLWRKAIDAYAKAQPTRVHDWIIGKKAPPPEVFAESKHQLRCMLQAMFDEAAKPKSTLTMDVADQLGQSKKDRKRRADRFRKSTRTRERMTRHISRSFYRGAWAQGSIWYSKFSFRSRNFNHISAHAARKCRGLSGVRKGWSWRPKKKSHRKCWFKKLSKSQREREILNASSAPGISRHHWGTEFDLFSLNPRRFRKKDELHDEYVWMTGQGQKFGFFQPYLGRKKFGPHTYIEERWHWSYYPIAHALTEYVQTHEKQIERALTAQWNALERRWGRRNGPYFSYVRKHWRAYMLKNIQQIEVAGLHLFDATVFALNLPAITMILSIV